MTPNEQEGAEIHFYSRPASGDPSAWTEHAKGKIETVQGTPTLRKEPLGDSFDQEAEKSVQEFYRDQYGRGLEYGPDFQAIQWITQQQKEVLSKIKLGEGLIPQSGKYQLHPVLLDACFQTLLLALPGSNQTPTFHFIRVSRFTIDECQAGIMVCAIPQVKTACGRRHRLVRRRAVAAAVRAFLKKDLESSKKASMIAHEVSWESPPDTRMNHNQSLADFSDRQDTGKALSQRL
jgi:hypothetical protein